MDFQSRFSRNAYFTDTSVCDVADDLMRHQVPTGVFTSLVYLSAVACISVEISLGSCWCRDILRVKDQGFITNCNFL